MTTNAAVCLAKIHDSFYSYRRYHCRCPTIVRLIRQRQKRYRDRRKANGGNYRYEVDPFDLKLLVRRVWEGQPVRIDNDVLRSAVINRLDTNPQDRLKYNSVYDGPLSSRQIANAVGCTQRTVTRWRARRRKAHAITEEKAA
jgi:hypothetical protein